jgi:hypothetical protein
VMIQKLLDKFINLLAAPRAVRWETSEQRGRDDWSPAAVLSLDDANVAALLKAAKPLERAAPPTRFRRVIW